MASSKRRRQSYDAAGDTADATPSLLPATPAMGFVDSDLTAPVTLLTEKWKLLPAFLKVCFLWP